MKLLKFLLPLSLLFLLCGGAASGEARIYTGIFGLWAWGDWNEALGIVKENGFDIAVGVSDKRVLDYAHSLGIKCIVDYALTTETASDERKWDKYLQGLKAKVEELKDHPAVFAWYIVDEPAWHKIPLEKIKEAQKVVRSVDPHRPLFSVLGPPDNWYAYLPFFDIIAIAPYLQKKPDSSYDTPEKVADWIKKIRTDLGRAKLHKPVWIVLGAFEEKSKIPFLFRSPFKKPTPEGLNQMVKIGIAEKVDGILIWTLSFKNSPKYKDWRLPQDDPALWESVRKIPSVVRNTQ